MREERKHGCGCGALVLLAVISVLLIGGIVFVLNKYVVIVPRESLSPAPSRTPEQKAVPTATPQPVVQIGPTSTPVATVDLVELQLRMQDWPDEVTLASQAVFPGDVTAPAGTNVKLISAGPEVEVEYQDEKAKLLADQTDLVARVLLHRSQAAREQEIDRGLAALAASRAKHETDAKTMEVERKYGKEPSHEDAYFGVKTFLKQAAKDPDSVEIISVSPVYPAEFGGRKCWATKVIFHSRDELGFSKNETGTAYVGGDKAIGYERAP